jgi:tetratricopeptide (TPR) repeat protein
LRKKWLLDLYLHHFAAALSSGAALVAADSTAATEDYYARQLVAAKSADDSASAHRLATDAAARFPKNADFLLVLAREALDKGAAVEALGLIERALSIEPANALAWQLAIAAHGKVGAPDSAVASAPCWRRSPRKRSPKPRARRSARIGTPRSAWRRRSTVWLHRHATASTSAWRPSRWRRMRSSHSPH